jgi:tetratricopeptide (TPR) repeat protein
MTAELDPLVRKDPLWLEAADPLQAEDWERALPLLDEILRIDPADAAARFNRASAWRNTGRPDAALAEFEAIRPNFDDEGVYHANVARTLEELGRGAEAAGAYERALQTLPGDPFILDRLAALGRIVPVEGPEGETVYISAEEFAEAVREDLAQHADDPDYLANLAAAMLEQDHVDLARSAAELALAARSDHSAAQLFLSVALARLGRLDEALGRVDEHLAAVPASAAGHVHRAHVLYALGEHDEARAGAERALALDPNALPAMQLLVAGDDGPAAALERAVALADRLPRAWGPRHLAGDLALTAGDEERAVGHYERSIELGAGDEAIRTALGELGRRGRIDDLVHLADLLPGLATRDAGLRWNVAAGYAEAGRESEARIVFASIAHDGGVPPDLRAAAEQRMGELAP